MPPPLIGARVFPFTLPTPYTTSADTPPPPLATAPRTAHPALGHPTRTHHSIGSFLPLGDTAPAVASGISRSRAGKFRFHTSCRLPASSSPYPAGRTLTPLLLVSALPRLCSGCTLWRGWIQSRTSSPAPCTSSSALRKTLPTARPQEYPTAYGHTGVHHPIAKLRD